MKGLCLVFLLFPATAFAELQAGREEYPYKDPVKTADNSQEEVTLMRELNEWNGGFAQKDYIVEVRGRSSTWYNMQGIAPPTGRVGRKWVACNDSMITTRDMSRYGWKRTPGGKWRNPGYWVQRGGQLCSPM